MSALHQAGNTAGLIFVILMAICFGSLVYEGGKVLWDDITTGIAEAQRRMDRER